MDYKKYRLKVASVIRDNLMSIPSYALGSIMTPIDIAMEWKGVNKPVSLEDLQKMEDNTYGAFIPGVRAFRAGAKSKFTEKLLTGLDDTSKNNALAAITTTLVPTLLGALINKARGKSMMQGALIGSIPALLGFGASFVKSMHTPASKEELQKYYKNPNRLATYLLPGYAMYYRSQAAKYADKMLAESKSNNDKIRYAFA